MVEELRLAGRWDEALASLGGRDDADAAQERVLVLADRNMVQGGYGDQVEAALDDLAGLAGGDRRIEAFVLARRGLKLHSEFLRNRDAGEPPDELPLFEQALAIRREIGDEEGVAESLFHIGLVHQVVRGDSPASQPWFQESYDRAREQGDELLMSYAVRHLGFASQEAGDNETAERQFRESLELRKRAGWRAGVAAAELALAMLYAEQDRSDEANALAESARATFTELAATHMLGILEANFSVR